MSYNLFNISQGLILNLLAVIQSQRLGGMTKHCPEVNELDEKWPKVD